MGLAFVVVLLGSRIRWSDAGMGCPDWPGCYGKFFGVPNTSAEIYLANTGFPFRDFDKNDVVRESTHRYLANVVSKGVLRDLKRLLRASRIG